MLLTSRSFFSNNTERVLISFIISHLLQLPDHKCKSVSLANALLESFGTVCNMFAWYQRTSLPGSEKNSMVFSIWLSVILIYLLLVWIVVLYNRLKEYHQMIMFISSPPLSMLWICTLRQRIILIMQVSVVHHLVCMQGICGGKQRKRIWLITFLRMLRWNHSESKSFMVNECCCYYW